MKKLFSTIIPSVALGILMSNTAFAADHPGKALHAQADCMKCHAAKPYEPAKSDSWPKLLKTVQSCSDNLNTGMFEDEVEQLADYLNNEYYKHPK
jgi:hypothetical protein